MLNDCYFQVKPFDGYIEINQLPSRYSHEITSNKFFLKDKKEILIGRDKSCDIKLCWDKTYSKFQTTIAWDDLLEQWKIIDGGKSGSSRNGTWVFANKSHELVNGTVFRVAFTKVEVVYDNFNDNEKEIQGESDKEDM